MWRFYSRFDFLNIYYGGARGCDTRTWDDSRDGQRGRRTRVVVVVEGQIGNLPGPYNPFDPIRNTTTTVVTPEPRSFTTPPFLLACVFLSYAHSISTFPPPPPLSPPCPIQASIRYIQRYRFQFSIAGPARVIWGTITCVNFVGCPPARLPIRLLWNSVLHERHGRSMGNTRTWRYSEHIDRLDPRCQIDFRFRLIGSGNILTNPDFGRAQKAPRKGIGGRRTWFVPVTFRGRVAVTSFVYDTTLESR